LRIDAIPSPSVLDENNLNRKFDLGYFGGAFGLKTEAHHRGMKLGIAPHCPDDWGRQLAAGGA